MVCKCGNKFAYAMRFTVDGESCDRCSGVKPRGVPDVYFRSPYMDPNLPHPNRPWEKDGVWVESKEHKKRLMDEQGLVERGDRRHGERNFYANTEAAWKNMGIKR